MRSTILKQFRLYELYYKTVYYFENVTILFYKYKLTIKSANNKNHIVQQNSGKVTPGAKHFSHFLPLATLRTEPLP